MAHVAPGSSFGSLPLHSRAGSMQAGQTRQYEGPGQPHPEVGRANGTLVVAVGHARRPCLAARTSRRSCCCLTLWILTWPQRPRWALPPPKGSLPVTHSRRHQAVRATTIHQSPGCTGRAISTQPPASDETHAKHHGVSRPQPKTLHAAALRATHVGQPTPASSMSDRASSAIWLAMTAAWMVAASQPAALSSHPTPFASSATRMVRVAASGITPPSHA